MLSLNLPPCGIKIINREGKKKIFDVLRRRYVALTLEEWVRQHFIHFLIDHKGYPSSFTANEVMIKLNGTTKRCDTVVYSSDFTPRMIIEYKSPECTVSQAVFDQIMRYNFVLKVDYLVVSNGIDHFCCQIDYARNTYHFLPDVPCYKEL
ncbi:MAG: type I restriction enzyme HsdR N-terminal domain-containing protein [Bacteroides sp.]|nr:type I restriction enzyme HsdR N-terminal domain-containing protein [Bacteroides sp.]